MIDNLNPLTAQEIEELKRLEAEATKGPWRVSGAGLSALVRNAKEEIVARRHRAGSHDNEHDIAVIAAARNSLPRLIADVERLQKWHEDRGKIIDGLIAEKLQLNTELTSLRTQLLKEQQLHGVALLEHDKLRTQLAEAKAEIERLKQLPLVQCAEQDELPYDEAFLVENEEQ